MSIRIVLEQHVKNRLMESFNDSNYPVLESLRTKERPIPSIVVIAGDATPAFDNSDLTGNYRVPLSIVALSSLDKSTPEEHNDVVQRILSKMREYNTRRVSTIKELYLYQINSQSVAQDNSDRKMGVAIEYECIVNYAPDLKIS